MMENVLQRIRSRLDNPEQSHLPPAPFLITHLLGRLEWFHLSQITSPPPSPPGTTSNSITFSNPPVVHDLDLILCDTFSIMKYSGNSIGEQFRL